MIEHIDAAWEELTAAGAPFSIDTTEVNGRAMRCFSTAPANMRVVWENTRPHDDQVYVVFEDEQYTYGEFDANVRALAHYLRDVHGVGSGDRVAVAMRNYPEWLIAYWATATLGAALVGMNAWWTAKELVFGLADSTPKVLIADDERVERIAPYLDELRADRPLHLITVRTERELPSGADRWADIIDPTSAPAGLPTATIDPNDDVTIFYTSGTTGVPKGAQLTHRGSVQNMYDMLFMPSVARLAEAKAIEAGDRPAPVEPDERNDRLAFLAPTPLFHVTATNCLMHPCTFVGGKLVLMYKWNAGRALELIERERITNLSGVPTMSRELLMHPDWPTRDTSSLKSMGGGGAAIQPDLVEKIDASLSGGGPATGYGLTETHGIITANSATMYTAKPASCGRVVPVLEAKLVDEFGADITPDPMAVGQLCVRGPVVIKGYLNRPDATADAIRDGWFNTGDIARIDADGYVFIVDRAKDMVIRGGENVYCAEVEAAIYQHPDIAQAAVFGLPDDRLGEIVAVAVVARAGATLVEDDLRAFAAERIAAFKVPERWWIRDDELPVNASGKFLKRELRETLLDE